MSSISPIALSTALLYNYDAARVFELAQSF